MRPRISTTINLSSISPRRSVMSRVQLALNVPDIEAAVAFYSKLFATEPHKRKPGYANFAIVDPPLKLVLFEQPDATPDLVTDRSYRLHTEPCGIIQHPVLVSLARVRRAGVATPHRHHDIDCSQHVIGPRLGNLAADVDADLCHRFDRARVDRRS